MFQGAFLPNLCVFLLAQLVAMGYLRTGLVTRGVWLMVAAWVLADTALVARFAYEHEGLWFYGSLFVMQAWTLFETIRFGFGQWRRRRPLFRAERDRLDRETFIAYMRDDLETAVAGYQQMVRKDPWDLAARIGLGRALLRTGSAKAGKRELKQARRLDRGGRYLELIDAVARQESRPSESKEESEASQQSA